MRVHWLSADEERAWRAYREMSSRLNFHVWTELNRDTGLSEADYEVLSTLSEKPGRHWPLHELAAKMMWSRSRLSHHVTRMERRNLVTRAADPDDRRGCLLALAEDGSAELKRAAPFHVNSVRRHLIDLLDPEDLAALTRIGERVVTSSTTHTPHV